LANDVKDRGTIVAQGGGKVKDHRANKNPYSESHILLNKN